jgi:hypothetical protein
LHEIRATRAAPLPPDRSLKQEHGTVSELNGRGSTETSRPSFDLRYGAENRPSNQNDWGRTETSRPSFNLRCVSEVSENHPPLPPSLLQRWSRLRPLSYILHPKLKPLSPIGLSPVWGRKLRFSRLQRPWPPTPTSSTHSSALLMPNPGRVVLADRGWRFKAAFGCLCILTLMVALNATVLAIALPVSIPLFDSQSFGILGEDADR